MKNNFLRKEQNLSKTPSVKKRTPSHMRVQSFDSYFQDVLARKNNQYTVIDSPHLNQRLSDISTLLNDKYISAMSTPTTKITKHLQRKKYTDLKSKIEKSIARFQQSKISSVKDLFEWKQVLLTEFLNEFTSQIQKQCKEKGQILKYIWNSMFAMIEHISQQLSISLQKKEKLELANSLKQHESYQKMIENQRQKQSVLNERYDGYKVTISKLIYELRFKRKQINKLYKNQKMLVNKLNQYKNDNLDMQNNYIELMSSMRDLPPESVEQMLRAREEINRNRNLRLKVQGNRKTNRAEIAQELKNDRTQQISELFEEIKVIANQQFDSPHLIGTLIEAAIENYGIFHDDGKETEQKIIEVIQTKATNDAGTQIDDYSFKNPHKKQQTTQFSYIQRLTADLINSKVTQTYCEFNKKKILIDRAVGTQKEIIRRYVELKFRIEKVCFQNIWLKREEPPNIVMSPINFDRSHKKHMSQLNLIRGKFYHKNTIKDSQHQSSLFDGNQRDQNSSELPFQLEQRQPRATQKTYQAGRSKKLKKMTHVSQRSYAPLQLKKTESKIQVKQPLPRQQNNRSQYTTPPSRFKEASVKQEASVKNDESNVLRSQQKKKSGASPTSQYAKLRSDLVRSNFLSTKNCFNILIDEKKEQQITSFFTKKAQKKSNNLFLDLQEQDIEWSQTDLENQVILATLNQIDNLPGSSASRKGSMNFIGRSPQHRVSMQLNYEDQNELLMKVCRSKYFKKGRKEREDKGKIFQFRDQYTSVKDNIEMIAKDVHQLMINKEQLLTKTASGKNLKNMYKILMMTFAKAYDCYNKQLPITNLVHPLFESLSLIYGAINTTEVYKKMINFIASITVMPDNTILRFFLFFLGLDRTSPYSSHVTISQVYLCLALLEKISIEGKVTLNIDSIYTDTSRIKEQLGVILSQQKIPSHLCANIKKRVQFQLENSATLRKSGEGEGHFKINIYNIILLIIKEVIKGKTKLRQSFTPIFEYCYEQKQINRIPVDLLELTLSMCHGKGKKKHSIDLLLNTLKRSTQFLKIQQFCSILFDYNLICLEQLLQENNFVRYRWKVPELFTIAIKNNVSRAKEVHISQKFEFRLYTRLSDAVRDQSSQGYTRIEAMKKLIFTKWYFERVEDVLDQMVGNDLHCIGTIASQQSQ